MPETHAEFHLSFAVDEQGVKSLFQPGKFRLLLTHSVLVLGVSALHHTHQPPYLAQQHHVSVLTATFLTLHELPQGVYKANLTKFQEISRIYFQKIPEDFYETCHTITPVIIVILFTRGLPYIQCTKNCLTCKNYTANLTNFQGASTKLHEISSISSSNFKFHEISTSCTHPVPEILQYN